MSDDTARGGTPWTAFERTAQERTSRATIANEHSAWIPEKGSHESRKPPKRTSAATAAKGSANSRAFRASPWSPAESAIMATATSRTGRTRRPIANSFAPGPDDPSILRANHDERSEEG